MVGAGAAGEAAEDAAEEARGWRVVVVVLMLLLLAAGCRVDDGEGRTEPSVAAVCEVPSAWSMRRRRQQQVVDRKDA